MNSVGILSLATVLGHWCLGILWDLGHWALVLLLPASVLQLKVEGAMSKRVVLAMSGGVDSSVAAWRIGSTCRFTRSISRTTSAGSWTISPTNTAAAARLIRASFATIGSSSA